MGLRTVVSLAAAGMIATLGSPGAASADFPHVVTAGESLTSVAAADGLTVAQLAAANGLSPFAQLVAGTTLQIPPQAGPVTAPVASSTAPTGESSATVGEPDGGDADDSGATAAPTSAPATSYVVQPGDTLSAIAARAGTTVGALAAANGLDPNGVLLAGSALQLSGSGTGAAQAPAPTFASYVVQPGDTLTAIATRAGTTVHALAAANGLDPNGVLLSGSVLHLSGSSGASAQSSAAGQPIGQASIGTAGGPPYPTPETVSSSQVGSIASANGVSPSLAAAIGYQESGFNNDLVSPTGAVGVMQIEPGTWDWIQRSLTAGTPLNPSSASDNIRGGVLMLHALLNSTGGDQALAAAGYYQGLASVQQNGMYSDTQQYVNDVMALKQQFGGG